MMYRFTFVLLLLGVCWNSASSKRVLLLTPVGSQSHMNIFYQVGKGLVANGHDVTIATMYPPRNIKGITEIHLKEVYDSVMNDKDAKADLIGQMNPKASDKNTAEMLLRFSTKFTASCVQLLDTQLMKNLVSKGLQDPYDTVIANAFLNECIMPISVKIGKSMIQLSSGSISHVTAFELNVPHPYSTIPCIMLPYVGSMSFVQRVINTATNLVFHGAFQFLMYPAVNEVVQAKYPGFPTINEAKRETSLVLLNRIAAIEGSIPTLPYVQEIGGINSQVAKPLPKDLEDFVQGAGDAGVIYVALGSVVPEELMPEENKLIFIEAFSKLPQRVIWKFKETRKDIPKNVKTVTWAPQQDILGHPKCKAFISHGGANSLSEAIFHGVPVIGMPVFADQPPNVLKAAAKGYAVPLFWADLTVENLLNQLNEVVNNTKYKIRAKELSKLALDQPQKPMDKAVYWIEYVMNHDGAKHMRTAADNLNFFQYFLLDVIGAALLTLFVTLYVTWKILQFVFCKLCCRRNKKNTGNKKLKTKKNN